MRHARRTCILLTFVLGAAISCGNRTIHSGDLTLAAKPASMPEDFPPELMYPGGKIVLLGVLDTAGFWSPAQYAVLIESSDPGDTVVAHYLDLLKRDNWQILQSRNFEPQQKTVIVAESLVQQTVTLVVENGKSARIKLFLKKSSDD